MSASGAVLAAPCPGLSGERRGSGHKRPWGGCSRGGPGCVLRTMENQTGFKRESILQLAFPTDQNLPHHTL